jgi:putative PIN family toxin of toxin-antitoxin system
MLSVVIDTMLFVRALLNSRSLPARIIAAHPERYRLFLSRPVVEEILEVLARPELIQRLQLRQVDYAAAIGGLLASFQQAETVELGEIAAVSRDPKDDKFLATAKAGGANYVVSEDEDLLVLGEYEGIPIINAADFSGLLEQGKPA